MQIKVYTKTRTRKENVVNAFGVIEEIKKIITNYSTTLIHKDGITHYYKVVFIDCQPIQENSIIEFEISSCGVRNRIKDFFNMNTRRIEKKEENTLFIRDYRIIEKIEREDTKPEDLPF